MVKNALVWTTSIVIGLLMLFIALAPVFIVVHFVAKFW